MRFSIAAIVILMLVPGWLRGQAVDPSVPIPDPSVDVRVQDVDHPISALLPGGSVAWTGQPVMSHPSAVPGQKNPGSGGNQFPSLVGTSNWGPSQGVASSTSSAAVGQTPSARPLKKSSLSRKLDEMMASVDLHSAKTSSSRDELLLEQAQLTRNSAALTLRSMRQVASRSARERATNPLRSSADAAAGGRWQADQSSARVLAQQQHESNLLLKSGYGAPKKRRWHRGKKHTLGAHDW